MPHDADIPAEFQDDECVGSWMRHLRDTRPAMPRDQRIAIALQSCREGKHPSSSSHDSDNSAESYVDLEGAAIFQAGRFASEFDASGNPIAYVSYSEADLDYLVRNHTHLLATGQRVPIKHEHDGEGAIGWVGRMWRVGSKLFADFTGVVPEFARMFSEDRLLGRSVEITAKPEGFNYRGVHGPTIKALAWLTDALPRVKTLDSSVYADSFEDAATGGYVSITFQEQPMPEQKVAAAVAESDASTEAAVEEAKDGGMAALAKNLEDMQAAVEKIAARLDVIDGGPDGKAVEAGEHEDEDDEKKKLEAGEHEDDDKKKKKLEDQVTMSEVKILRQRAEASEAQSCALLQVHREGKVQEFAESCRDRYGIARTDELVTVYRRKVGAIDTLETFDETGASRLDTVAEELLTIAGPRTVHRTPGAVGRSNVIGKQNEAETAEQATETFFSELDPQMQAHYRLPDQAKVVESIVQKRLAAQEK